MPDDLYDRDILTWSEHQAALLRRLAAGERVNDAVDWENVIEEVESVGRSEFHACESLLTQASIHLLKLHAWPSSRNAQHWSVETLGFLLGARRRFTPSMRQHLDLAGIFADAAYLTATMEDDSGAPRPAPETCPYVLGDLLADRPVVADLVARLAAADDGPAR